MKEILISGNYNSAKVFTDVIEEEAIGQIQELCDQEFCKNSKIRIMPDVHAGAGCTIGTTMTIKDKIVPDLVGVDIGCAVKVVKLEETNINLQKLDSFIPTYIPSGKNVREVPHTLADEKVLKLEDLHCKDKVSLKRAYKSIGTLGGGNHFIEVDKDENGSLYLVIHCGSRHLGKEVADFYQEEGYKRLCGNSKTDIDRVIKELKEKGEFSQIQSTIEEIKKKEHPKIPKQLAYVEKELFSSYLHDMDIVQKFAQVNRDVIAQDIISNMNLHVAEEFTTVHNYIDLDSMILRKGAVSAKAGEKLLIPINMRDGSLICIGKGNEDWNYSAPHGAGRLYSRRKAKESFSVEEYEKSMTGIFSTSINFDTLDECPMAYKSIGDILDNIGPTVNVLDVIKPIYNFKAGE